MSDLKYRLIFIGLGVALVAVAVIGWRFGSPEADVAGLPDVIEELSPVPGSQVPLQTPIEIDVPVAYRIEMFVDNFRVPDAELRFVEGTGVYSFDPSRSSVIEWGPGQHRIVIRWNKLGGLPDTGEFAWTFRVF